MINRSAAAAVGSFVILTVTAVGCGGEAVDRAATTATLQACLEAQGAEVKPMPELASGLSIDADALEVDLEAADLTVWVTDDDAAADRAFEAVAQTLGAGADPLDFFVEGSVVVLFGEESTPEEAEMVRDCAREAES